MPTLYITSTNAFAGKMLLALALGADAVRRGQQVRYFKPVGPNPVAINGVLTDQDALFVNEALQLAESPDMLSAVTVTAEFKQQVYAGTEPPLAEKVREVHARLQAGADLVLAGGMGSLFYHGAAFGLDARAVADVLGARTVVVSRYARDFTTDELMAARKVLGDGMLGAFINAVRRDQVAQVRETMMPFLERHGVPVFGVLPEDPLLESLPVRELAEGLNAEILVGNQSLDELVENFAVGAMNPEAALSHFRKVTNKAVVTGGDRSDIQRAALETSTKALVLTGGLAPANVILSTAAERNVPVLLVDEDTLTTVERIENMMAHVRIHQPRKFDRAVSLVSEHADLVRLWSMIG